MWSLTRLDIAKDLFRHGLTLMNTDLVETLNAKHYPSVLLRTRIRNGSTGSPSKFIRSSDPNVKVMEQAACFAGGGAIYSMKGV